MSHIYGLANINLLQPSVVTIGVFDGVHKGHQHLIKRLVAESHAMGKLAVVLTFFPHPDVVVHGITKRYYLTSPEERAQYLLDLGVDYVITHPFNDEVRKIRAADFVDQLLTHLHVTDLWVGADFTLGYKREGDVAFLAEQGEKKGFSVNPISLVHTEEKFGAISSTLIRDALARGDVESVREWLGRGYTVSGKVVHGAKRGRTIGFPTANLETWGHKVIPTHGVYAGWAWLDDERFMAMTNVGISPMFEYKGITVETYLLDFDRSIYNETLTISFEKYLRPEAKFDSLEALIKQIHDDCDAGRTYLMQLAEEN